MRGPKPALFTATFAIADRHNIHWLSREVPSKARHLTAVALLTSKRLLANNTQQFRDATVEDAASEGCTPVQLLAGDLYNAYGKGNWSLLSDKPERPADKALQLETLDA